MSSGPSGTGKRSLGADKSEGPPAKQRRVTSRNSGKHSQATTQEDRSQLPLAALSNVLSVTARGAIKVASRKSAGSTSTKNSSSKAKRAKLEPNPIVLPFTSVGDDDNDNEAICDQEVDEPGNTIIDDDEENNEVIGWGKSHLQNLEGQDIIATANDEIALEGLDGITLEALWTRMEVALNHTISLSDHLRTYIWNNVKQEAHIECYELESPRGILRLTREGSTSGEDIYPFVPINDTKKNTMGSCATYNTRRPLDVQQLSLREAEVMYGNRLILVGTPELRRHALISPYADPLITFFGNQYCILERIGRSRRRGEMTTGSRSLSMMTKDAKTLFYYRSRLQQMQLISKQQCQTRTDRKANASAGLLHLHRFFTEIKSKRQLIVEHIVKLIKQKPKCRMEYVELRQIIGNDVWERFMISKVVKSDEFRQFIRSDWLPYREMYPNAVPQEWRRKAKDAEKTVRVLQLRNPNLNINSIFKDEKDDKEDVEGNNVLSDSDDEYPVPFGVPAARRIYQAIYNTGLKGIKMRRLSRLSNCDHYCVRNICKSLRDRGLIEHILHDSRRQHFMVFIATAHKAESIKEEPVSQESNEEEPETLDFIANVLNVEPECLKSSDSKSSELANPFPNYTSNVYTIVQQLRKVKDTNNLNIYYANQRPFFDVHAQEIQTISPGVNVDSNPDMKKFVATLFDTQMETSEKQSIFPSKNTRTTLNSSVERSILQKVKVHPPRKLKSFRPFLQLLNPKYKVKLYHTYLKMLPAVSEQTLSSSEEEEYEDANSEDALMSGLDFSPKEKVSKDVKLVIINNFDDKTTPLAQKFHEPASVPIEMPAPAVREVKMTKENFFNVDMEIFMGPKPQIAFVQKDSLEVETMLVVSSKPDDFVDRRPLVSQSQRAQSRLQLVRNCITSQKMIIDIIKVQNIITQTEKSEGYNVNIDKKSMQRILTTLVRDGEFAIVKIILRYADVVRTKNMMTLPHSDVRSLTQSYVDQFKSSFVIYAKRKVFEQEGKVSAIPAMIRRRFKYSRFIGRTYGFNPKVAKMRSLHEFLFYLIRGYDGFPILREEARNVFLNYCDPESIESVMGEATTLFHREASWKMFVSPLPTHKSWPDGWALISDILLRLPLSLFVKVCNVSFIIPELPSYLNHPVRKHFIVTNLPSEIKEALLNYRKYIFAIHEIFRFLAYMGLVQFGPQKIREKDQLFFYFNRNAILYNTTSSEVGYHQITKKEYPKNTYCFNSMPDVEKYWADMYCFAINTRLGSRHSVVGQNIQLEYVHAKPLLIAALKPQSTENAPLNDVGYLPGDGLGACCSDSALWLHVRKNWFWYAKPPKTNPNHQHTITGLRRKHLEDVRPMKLSDLHQVRKGRKYKIIGPASGTSTGLGIKKSKLKVARGDRKLKKTMILRKVKPRKSGIKRRVCIDPTDKKIRDRMGKSRAVFTDDEDKVIIICMACADYLTTFNKKRYVTYTTIRDLIQNLLHCPKKTSFAYRRRTVQLRKSNNFDERKHVLNFELTSDFFTEKHFGKIRNDLKRNSGTFVSDIHLNLAFLYLAFCTYKRWRGNACSASNVDEVQDFLAPANVHRYVPLSEKEDFFCQDPVTDEDINMDTIQSVIHSSLGGQVESQEWPFQLLRVYQSFSEDLLRSALVNLRNYQIISGVKMKTSQGGTIQMSGMTYNLSFNYTFKQITQFPHCIFTEAHELFATIFLKMKKLKSSGLSIERFEQGHGLGVAEFQSSRLLHYIFDLPEDIITLNPKIKDFSELAKELARRYKELMTKTQDNDEFDVDVAKNLETSLEMFMSDEGQEGSDEAVEPESAVSSDTSENRIAITKPPDYGAFAKADRRHKTWKISDMAFMLTKGLFPELDDEERLEKLNEHFIVRYPTCRIQLDDDIANKDALFNECHTAIVHDAHDIYEKVLNDAIIKNTVNWGDFILDPNDKAIADFIYLKGSIGATRIDMLTQFPCLDVNALHRLINVGLILRVGVCNFMFVHHNYRHNWSICLNVGDKEKCESNYDGCRLRISPWIRINGTVNYKLLEKWLSIILTHCLSYPCIMFSRLCARFNIIKPVDIYYILEILQRLGCVQIWRYERDDIDVDIFAEFDILPQVPGTIMDDFDDVFVETETTAITKFGAFLNRNKTDFAYRFEEEE